MPIFKVLARLVAQDGALLELTGHLLHGEGLDILL